MSNAKISTTTNTTTAPTAETIEAKIAEGTAILEKLYTERANIEKRYETVKDSITKTENAISVLKDKLAEVKKNEPVGFSPFDIGDGKRVFLNAYEDKKTGKYYVEWDGKRYAVDKSSIVFIVAPEWCADTPNKTKNNKKNKQTVKPTASELISEILEKETGKSKKSAEVAKPTATEPSENGVKVSFNKEKKGIEVSFSAKPTDEVLAEMKANGFRWSKYQKLWYAQKNSKTVAVAEKLSGKVFEKAPKSDAKVSEKSKNTPEVNKTKKETAPDAAPSDKLGLLGELLKAAEESKKNKKTREDQARDNLAKARENKAKYAEAEKTCASKVEYVENGKVVKVEYKDKNGKVFCTKTEGGNEFCTKNNKK